MDTRTREKGENVMEVTACTNCFAWGGMHRKCVIMVDKTYTGMTYEPCEGCPFYKTRDQYTMEQIDTYKKLRAEYGVDHPYTMMAAKNIKRRGDEV